MPLCSLDLDCCAAPDAEMGLLFLSLWFEWSALLLSLGTGGGRMKQTSMAGLIILQPLTRRA